MNAMSPGLGHNQPPDDPDDPEFLTRLQARLDPEDKQIFDRLAELEVGQGQIPDPLP